MPDQEAHNTKGEASIIPSPSLLSAIFELLLIRLMRVITFRLFREEHGGCWSQLNTSVQIRSNKQTTSTAGACFHAESVAISIQGMTRRRPSETVTLEAFSPGFAACIRGCVDEKGGSTLTLWDAEGFVEIVRGNGTHHFEFKRVWLRAIEHIDPRCCVYICNTLDSDSRNAA
jgi:hypothetical protein